MKPVKAIDLVFRAQPMIATLRQIITQNCDESKMRVFIDDIDNWLDGARTLLQRGHGTDNSGKNLTPGTVCAGSLRPPRIVPGASTTQNEGEVEK